MVSQKHPIRPKLGINRSPRTAESRARSASCPFLYPSLPCAPSPTVSVSVQDTMARTKRKTRYTNSNGFSYYVQMSELSDRSPGDPSTPSDSILQEFEVQETSPMVVDMSEKEPALIEKEESTSSESLSDTESSSSSRHSPDLEERHSRLHEASEAMDKISASKMAAALLRVAIISQKRPFTDSPSKEKSKAFLRVHGFRRPISEKNKEATATLQVKTELKAAKKKNLELEKAVKDLQNQLQPVKHIHHAAEELHRLNKKLKERLVRQEAALTQQLSAKAESEKMALSQDMMEDSTAIMKMTWTALFPDSGYEQWESKFAACTEEYNIKIMQQANDQDEEKDEAADSSSDGEDEDEEEEEADIDKGETKKEEADANQEQAPANEPQESVLEEQAPIAEADQVVTVTETPLFNA
ncbi:histone H3.v1-like [Chenopodium quinoa]|uniref:histone H3.v1-like n=1 Tax=Chenopodium quinoa TaxID=63459 RepID=UPI000B76B9F2|nr:histone H3.v1-like [Chenopodium quinoa]